MEICQVFYSVICSPWDRVLGSERSVGLAGGAAERGREPELPQVACAAARDAGCGAFTSVLSLKCVFS